MTVSGGGRVGRRRAHAVTAAPVAGGVRVLRARAARALRSPHPYLMGLGLVVAVLAYWLATEVLLLPRFAKIPGPVRVVTEWLNPDPVFGVSIYSAEYYQHILYSIERVAIAFGLATAVGVPLGLMTGWSQKVRDYAFPIIELLRPIPILAWVPLAIMMFSGRETPVIFLAFLASFFVTVLNTHLGVKSIDDAYFRAAACLGSSPAQIFRHVVVPGALPYIFTGLQISMGVNWFSLVAAEMVSGNFGLGYLILNSYVSMTYVTIIIGMTTLGIVGALSSGIIRWLGNRLMQWRARSIGMDGQG
jgi:NitT/TauT family transport system permease protein